MNGVSKGSTGRGALAGAILLWAAASSPAVEVMLTVNPAADAAGAVAELRAALSQAAEDPQPDAIALYPQGRYVFADGERWDHTGVNLLPPVRRGQRLHLEGRGARLELPPDAPDGRFLLVEEAAALTVSDLTFAGGRAAPTSGPYHLRYGGALWTDGTVELRGCTFEGNSAPGNGGAIAALWNATLWIDDCRFAGNSTGTFGGAIDSVGAIPLIQDSHFQDNQSGMEGGALGTFGVVNVRNCRFAGNSAKTNGGAVRNTGSMRLAECTFAGNQAGEVGGAAANIGQAARLEIDGCTFEDNAAKLNGGAFDNRFGHAWVLRSTFAGNHSAAKGGAVGNWATVTLQECHFTGNESQADGGAILNHKGLLAIRCTFQGNTAGGSGGALCDHKMDPGELTTALLGGTLRGNHCIDGDGGGLAVTGEGTVALSATVITANVDAGGQAHDIRGPVTDAPAAVPPDALPPEGFPFEATPRERLRTAADLDVGQGT